VKETGKAVAMSLDCNSRYCYLDPYEGGKQAVAEATRNVACSGARPLAITDCLNFGSPEREEVMWSFVRAIEGMAEACAALGTPVVSGNVSFYNQTEDQPVFPTPTVGAVGLLDDHTKMVSQYFKNEGDAIVLVGETFPELGGSEYLSHIHGIERGKPPTVRLDMEAALQKLLAALADRRLVSSMHDVSGGGLLVCLAECCFNPAAAEPLGFEAAFNTGLRLDVALFSESQSRAVISCAADRLQAVLETAAGFGLPAEPIGKVTGGKISVAANGREVVRTAAQPLMNAWAGALPALMAGRPTSG